MSFPRYERYKDSGVEWLGNVPEHWVVWKITHAFDVIGSGTTPKSENVAYYEDGQVPWVNTGDLNDGELYTCAKRITDLAMADHSSLKVYPQGSVVIAMYGATIGKLALLMFPSTVNQACCVFAGGSTIIKEFLFFWFLGFRQNLRSLATGGGQPNISQEILRNLRLACPGPEEQRSITDFLDRETGTIDALIAEQRRLIDLLKEKRQSAISHAVTKGRNPDAPMKDSGVEWLGEVPGHWNVCPIKRKAVLITDGAHTSPETVDGVYDFVSTADIDGASIDFESCLKTSPSSYEYLVRTGCQPLQGDVLFSKDGTIGRTVVVTVQRNFVVASSLIIIRPDFHVLTSAYLHYLVNPALFVSRLRD